MTVQTVNNFFIEFRLKIMLKRILINLIPHRVKSIFCQNTGMLWIDRFVSFTHWVSMLVWME